MTFIYYAWITGAAGEALEAELNKAGPGSCKFVSCDISREEDIKVKVQLICVFCCTGNRFTVPSWTSHDHLRLTLCPAHHLTPS